MTGRIGVDVETEDRQARPTLWATNDDGEVTEIDEMSPGSDDEYGPSTWLTDEDMDLLRPHGRRRRLG